MIPLSGRAEFILQDGDEETRSNGESELEFVCRGYMYTRCSARLGLIGMRAC